LLTLLESFVSLDDAFVKSGFEDDRFISECQHFIQNQVSDDESYLLLKSFLDFLDSEIVTPLSDFSKLAILQTRLYRVSECLSNINRKLLTDRHVANINKSYRDRYKDLRITSATNLDELFALVENYLGNSERCFIVLFNSFLSDSKDSERQGDTKPSSEHVKQFEKEHRLCFAYKDGARQTDEFDYIFENNLLLPPNLQEELQGNLFLIPLYVGDLYFGYLLIDTEDTRSVLHETLGHSIAIGIRNCVQLKKVHEHTAQLKHVNRNLAKVANYDGLTGLANRSLFSEKLEQACRSAKLTEGHVALLFLDLDGFKYINDSMGHDAGDKLLITVGKRLQSLIRDQDIVARLGGDEFTILMTDIPHASVATRLAEAVIRVFQEPYKIEGRIFQITTSIGIAVFPDDAQDSDELMKYSDAAMYKAKDDGKNRYQYYTPALNIAALERVQLGSAIRDGLRHDEFYLAYQPRLRLKDQTVIGFEALARWQDKAGNPISPERFIPIAEELALIHELGSIILEKACLQAKVWSDAGTPTVMAVNLSTKQLQDEMIVEKVLQTVDDVGLEPRWLELEITESAAMVDVENNIKKLQALRDAGIRIAIDDFGTAYSSLNYLKRLPVSSLKIDQSFVKDIQDENDISNNTAIIRAVIALGKSMGYTLVAEGVETDAQRRFLELHDCDEVQGFFFAKPLSVEDASQFLGLKNSHLQAV